MTGSDWTPGSASGQHSSGVWLWHHTRSRRVRNSAGDIVEWPGISTDVQVTPKLQERPQTVVLERQHRSRNLIGEVGRLQRRP